MENVKDQCEREHYYVSCITPRERREYFAAMCNAKVGDFLDCRHWYMYAFDGGHWIVDNEKAFLYRNVDDNYQIVATVCIQDPKPEEWEVMAVNSVLQIMKMCGIFTPADHETAASVIAGACNALTVKAARQQESMLQAYLNSDYRAIKKLMRDK